jgi:hypothetical protein
VVEMMGLEPTTPCLQSQIGLHRYLRRQRTLQVVDTVVLSVSVRSGPVKTAVNGTLVARPVRATSTESCRRLRTGTPGELP